MYQYKLWKPFCKCKHAFMYHHNCMCHCTFQCTLYCSNCTAKIALHNVFHIFCFTAHLRHKQRPHTMSERINATRRAFAMSYLVLFLVPPSQTAEQFDQAVQVLTLQSIAPRCLPNSPLKDMKWGSLTPRGLY